MLTISEAAELIRLVQRGQLYRAFPFSIGSLVLLALAALCDATLIELILVWLRRQR